MHDGTKAPKRGRSVRTESGPTEHPSAFLDLHFFFPYFLRFLQWRGTHTDNVTNGYLSTTRKQVTDGTSGFSCCGLRFNRQFDPNGAIKTQNVRTIHRGNPALMTWLTRLSAGNK